MSTATLELSEANILRREWNGIDSFLSDIRNKPIQNDKSRGSDDNHSTAEWYGTATFDEAVKLGEYGWPEGLERIQTIRKDLKPIECEMAERHMAHYAEEGEEVEVGRFVTNEPECMVAFDVIKVPASGRIVKLVAVVNQSAGMDGEQVFLRGAAAVALADLLEQSGLRSEIWAVCPGEVSGGGDYGADFRILLKSAHQPLELDRMAFWLASPSTFRRLMFRAFEQIEPDLFIKHIGGSYQYPHNPKPEAGTILVDCLQCGFGNGLTNKTVPAFVQKMLDSFMEK